jgi:geranylgeranyl diphosphate synthase type I
LNEFLLKQLNDVTQKVNLTINQIFTQENTPKELYNASRHLMEAGGKRLRPFLVLKSCEIVGGEIEVALPIAVAIEFIHNFTLIHDDIIDNDDKRRKVQTVHVLWGIPIAITAGDMLFAKAYEAVLYNIDCKKVTSKRLLKILDEITKATILVCEGQALDILYEHKQDVSEKEYFNKKASLHEIEDIKQIFRSLKSIDYAITKAKMLQKRAINHLLSFPPTPTREALLKICEYFIMREY